ncbi:hypothetical protein F511_23120 [Dorcoceras hygrometricum]|uniref:Uncharacterized protein n=1 Tax=Dorcoceras hygrometricum TaxID=472368 RepID=A0A2Z7AJM7_9LAMI|nr:hypothetical protein F511_23120 [Dorcoceras hygrometricum]
MPERDGFIVDDMEDEEEYVDEEDFVRILTSSSLPPTPPRLPLPLARAPSIFLVISRFDRPNLESSIPVARPPGRAKAVVMMRAMCGARLLCLHASAKPYRYWFEPWLALRELIGLEGGPVDEVPAKCGRNSENEGVVGWVVMGGEG